MEVLGRILTNYSQGYKGGSDDGGADDSASTSTASSEWLEVADSHDLNHDRNTLPPNISDIIRHVATQLTYANEQKPNIVICNRTLLWTSFNHAVMMWL